MCKSNRNETMAFNDTTIELESLQYLFKVIGKDYAKANKN